MDTILVISSNAAGCKRSAQRRANIFKINFNVNCTNEESDTAKIPRQTFRATRHLQDRSSPTIFANVDSANQASFSDLNLEANTSHNVQYDQKKFGTLSQNVDSQLGEKNLFKSVASTGSINEHGTRRVRFSSFVTINIDQDDAPSEAHQAGEHNTESCCTPPETSPSIVARLAAVLSRNIPCMMQKLPPDH